MTASQTPAQNFTSGYSLVNGIQMYYEIYGGGNALVLIHGGGSTIETSFAKVIPLLCKTRKVIAVELQVHGRTGDRPAPESFEQDADDVAALLQNIGIAKADIMGFSNGGNTTMQLAIRHPQMVNKIIVASAFYKREGMYPWFWDFMPAATLQNMPAELQEAYKKVAPHPEKLETMHSKDRDRMLHFTDWSDDTLKSIAAPTLFIVGDKDVVTPEHTMAMHNLVTNSRLAVIPGGHGEYLGEITFKKETRLPLLTVGLMNEFLDGE
ncbi:MAG TPA: alpha/beta hydrolase [Chitinophagaceae bacterium]|nr:alpha/beta hydrolase [Chitinophagaceae bacterium]